MTLITEAGLVCLLQRLDPDIERAGKEYERLRAALVKYFDWRGGWPPEECADETLDRLMRRLEDAARMDGAAAIDDVRRYAHGIARLVLTERRRQRPSFAMDEAALARLASPDPFDDEGPLSPCFERCLDELPPESRMLAIEYYAAGSSGKIDNRRRLAALFGLSDNALRSRVQRVRDRLERCVTRCTAQATAGAERCASSSSRTTAARR